jgi:hypothetical protein
LAQDIEDDTIVLADIDKEEKARLLAQLLEHRKHRRTGVRGTTKAAQLDARRTAGNVGEAVSLLILICRLP